ncbi:MAG: phytanoyl-CoA dioxygenase family protein [Candidatus Poribacteria bacterium]
MSPLSQADLDFWQESGYVIARNAVPRENAERAEQAVWEFLGMDQVNSDTWYPDPPRRSIMVEIYQHQALWDNRQYPTIHRAFSQIWQKEKLWVSFDRASMNPPSLDPEAKERGLHWDANLENRPLGFGVQGVLYLTDTAENQGAFTCVPGFHHRIEEWLDSLPEDSTPQQQDLHALGSEKIAANAGDLIIWRTSLPHGASLNTSDKPRIVQYITMNPANDQSDEARKNRVNWWKERLAWGSAKGEEHHHGQVAELDSLGRKLLGLDKWSED